MEREIVGGPDPILSCGHPVPPDAAAGADVFCRRCEALEMPPHFVAYKETPVFTASTIPAGLLRDHSTKRGVWGKILVHKGRLRYRVPRLDRIWELVPGIEGSIAPEDLHSVEPLDDHVEFQVRFFHAPE